MGEGRETSDLRVYGNAIGLLVSDFFTGVIQRNNVFGNIGDVGLLNWGVLSLDATRNYWGAATGPGPDPADDVSNSSGATTTTTPFSRTPFPINPQFLP